MTSTLTPNPAKVRAIVNATPPHLRNQLADVLEYLQERARDNGRMAEGNVAKFLNSQAPEIQAIVRSIKDAADLPRDRPFVPKETDIERYASFGLDPVAATTFGDALDGLEVQSRLTERLGGDDSAREPDPITRRDQIEAAFDLHQGGQNG